MGTPNDIYHHTRSSLIDIVSANVADNTLESVMSASGLTQETVDANHMMELIRGPIYREFQTIVPKEGLKRQLTKLLGELQKAENIKQPAITKQSLSAKQSTSAKQGISQTQVSSQLNSSAAQTSSQKSSGSSSGSSSRASSGSRTDKASKKPASVRARIPGLTTIKAKAIGVPRAYFRDPRDDGFNLQMPLYGTDPHVVLDNGTRAIVRYWISEVALLDVEEIKKAGFRRYSFLVEEESHPNPTIVKLLEMLREEEEAEQEALMLERLAIEAKAAAERDIANVENGVVAQPQDAIQLKLEDIEKLVGQYAELEEVRLIATLRRDGEVLNTKGKGLDIEVLKTSVLQSLEKLSLTNFKQQYPHKTEVFSRCKSILVQHQSGLLYLLDYVDTIVLVYGTNDLNIGLMYSYASRAGLAEEDSEDSTGLSDEDFKEMA